MDIENILIKVKKEYDYGSTSIQSKKDKRRDDMKLYIKESEKDKINTNSVYVTVQMLMSIYWQNQIVVKWQGRDRFDREVAKNTNKIAKFDYKEMGISELDYDLEFYRFMTGVGVQTSDGFDFTSIVPKLKNLNPLSCVPDPDGGKIIKSHRFFGFEANMTFQEMKAMNFDDDNIKRLQGLSENELLIKQVQDNIRGYNTDLDFTDNALHTVYFHFCRLEEGKPYLVVTNPGVDYMLKSIELLPVTEEEKKDNTKIYYPIALKYYSYVPGDFFSVSVPDLQGDKQSIYGKLFNALIAMAIRNAYGDDRFVDVKKVKDLKGLKQPSLEGKIIPVALGKNESINNAVYQVAKDNPGNLPSNVKGYIEELGMLEVGIDRNTSGVLSNGNSTLGEREMAQRNANVRFLLSTKQGNWFEEFRWIQLWYRMYLANTLSTDEKLVYFNTSYSQTNYVFKKDEFLGKRDLRIELVNKAEKQQEIQAKKADRMALLPQLIAGARTENERVMLYRELLTAQGEDEEYIEALFPLTATELRAYDKLEAINENDIRGAVIDDVNDDHYTYIKIFMTADDNDVKEKAIQSRHEAIAYAGIMGGIDEGNMGENGAEKSALNVSSSQLTAGAIQNNNNVASLEDLNI